MGSVTGAGLAVACIAQWLSEWAVNPSFDHLECIAWQIGLRYFYSKLYDFEELLTHYLHTALLFLSLVFMIVHSDNCSTWYRTDTMPGNALL